MKINICLAQFFNLLTISIVLLGRVLDYCPLQQGLRHSLQVQTERKIRSTRLLSITTRIKTIIIFILGVKRLGTRLLSITTRIKTLLCLLRQMTLQQRTRLLSITTRIKTHII